MDAFCLGAPTGNGKPRHIVQRTRQGQDQRDDQPNDAKHNGTGTMLSQDVKSDGKGEDMAGHEEDEEEQLSNAEQFATKPAHHDLAGVGHTEHMGVFLFKLADNIAGICCDETDAHKDNQRSAYN